MPIDKPLADYFRPTKLEDVVGQKHLLDKNCIFYKTITGEFLPNMIFYGPPGVGKTTLANIIASNSNMKLYKLDATTASIDDIKNIINNFSFINSNQKVLLYLDEIQYFNKKQQQSILQFIENGKITLIASTTENPYFYIHKAVLSRCNVFEFKSVTYKDIFERLKVIKKELKINIDDESLEYIAHASNGDVRKSLNYLEFLYYSKEKITIDKVKETINKANINYDSKDDQHYDVLSAFHKSLRGSDTNAALFYLAKLLLGNDLISVCRRLLCVACEDVGLANPNAIVVTKACVDSALMLGLPEAKLPLSEATILLANSPKSNSTLAIDEAMNDVYLGKGVFIPRQVKNTHFDGADAKVKGQHYLYPHDFKNHYVKQQYLPDDIKDRKYYKPGDNKIEQSYLEYMKKIKNI